MFESFMKNPYWKNIYEKSSDNLKDYYKFKFNMIDKEYANEAINTLRKMENNFTKSDWEQLIAQSSGRAKYEYTKMMKEKFPD